MDSDVTRKFVSKIGVSSNPVDKPLGLSLAIGIKV